MAGKRRIGMFDEELKKFNDIYISYYDYTPYGEFYRTTLRYPAIKVTGLGVNAIFYPDFNGWIEDSDCYSERWGNTPKQFTIEDKEHFMRRLAEFGGWYPFDTENALRFASKAHEGQFRKDGVTPYIVHPKAVVRMLKLWGITQPILICAAYLHDVLEDTRVTEAEIEKCFTFMVSDCVKTLTRDKNESRTDYLRRVSECREAEALLIKCADRIYNTLDFIHDGKADYAREYFHEADCVFKATFEHCSSLDNKSIPYALKANVRRTAEALSSCLD